MKTAAELVPGYRVGHLIGEGGSAKVYLAERASDKLQLVLKILDPALREDASFLKRFMREYQLIAAIQNEHLPVIFDQGFTGGHAYIAMEYFGGGDLKERIRKGFTSLGALRVAPQIAKALDAIHERGVIHRDLKPQNILFMLAGRKLFEGESAAGLLYMHVNGDVPRLPAKLAGYQPIVDRLLAKQPQDRYQSARELFATIAI